MGRSGASRGNLTRILGLHSLKQHWDDASTDGSSDGTQDRAVLGVFQPLDVKGNRLRLDWDVHSRHHQIQGRSHVVEDLAHPIYNPSHIPNVLT